MTTRRTLALSLLLFATILALAACNLPRQTSPQEAAFTAAAQTVSAQLTLVSLATPTVPATNTPVPLPATNTPTPPPPPTQPPPTATLGCSDTMQFVSDVTVPDNTVMTPGQNFTKTWRIRNTGSCTWSTAYDTVFVNGNSMGAQSTTALAGSVPPNATVDISVSMSAPSTNGTYRGDYRMRNDKDVLFGGFYVLIVVGPTPAPTVGVHRSDQLTLDDDEGIDFDGGSITTGSSADILLDEVSASERYFRPENGTVIQEMSGVPSYSACQSASMSSTAVDLDDIDAPTIFCYKTSSGRYGRVEVEDIDSTSIDIDYTTWD